MGSQSCTNCCKIIIFILLAAIPISMICLGAVRYDECPMSKWIPLYMVVAGATLLVMMILGLVAYCTHRKQTTCVVITVHTMLALVMLFNLAWNICGSVWVFSRWESWDLLKDSNVLGCYNDLYLFAFAYLIIFWITFPCTYGTAIRTVRFENVDGDNC